MQAETAAKLERRASPRVVAAGLCNRPSDARCSEPGWYGAGPLALAVTMQLKSAGVRAGGVELV